MSFASGTASEDAETEDGSSRGPHSMPSNSDGSLGSNSVIHPDRYPKSLSAKPSRQRSLASQITPDQRLETFDELLREAGYVHTRVLTPKGERLGKDDATYTTRKASNEHAHDGRQSSGYVTSVASFLAWLSGRSTTTSSTLAAEDSKPPHNITNTESTDQQQALQAGQSQLQRNRNSARRLQPKSGRSSPSNAPNFTAHVSLHPIFTLACSLEPAELTSHVLSFSHSLFCSFRLSSLQQVIPSSSSNATLTPANYAPSANPRPKPHSRAASGQRNNGPPIRHAISSPQLQGSPTSVTPTSYTPRVGLQESRREESAASGGRRSPLPETWLGTLTTPALGSGQLQNGKAPSLRHKESFSAQSKNGAFSQRQSLRQKPSLSHMGKSAYSLPVSLRNSDRLSKNSQGRPSEKLLARTGSLTNARTKASHTSPVTVLCRSSSLGNPSKSKKKRVPLLAPSGETSAWPWTGEQRSAPLLPKINVHVANSAGVRPLARTGSASSANAFTSYSRGSGYNSLSRAGSAYTTISKSGTGAGTSAMASSSRLGYDDSIWGEYGHSPSANGFRRPLQHPIGESNDTDEDSENEPRLSNILAPHVKSGRPSMEPVERRASIRSLRACLERHHSVSTVNAPLVTSPSSAMSPANEPTTPNLVVSSPSHNFDPVHEEAPGRMIKRRSTGQSSAQRFGSGRRKDEREFDDNPFDELQPNCRRIEGANVDEERGRKGTRSLLRLGINGIRWSPSSSITGRNSSQNGGSRAPDKTKGKMTEREMERERLLWGTNWGRREMDRGD